MPTPPELPLPLASSVDSPATPSRPRVAVSTAVSVVDHASIDPWRPRGIRIYGTAETVELDGPRGPSPVIRITPTISWSWSINGPAMVDGKFAPHRTVH